MTGERESAASEVLAPCPFCGEAKRLEVVDDGVTEWIVCRKCGCDGPVARGADARNLLWNTRPDADWEREAMREACVRICGDQADRIKALYADELGMTDVRVACEMQCDSLAAQMCRLPITKGPQV